MTRAISLFAMVFAAALAAWPAGAANWNELRPLVADATPIGMQHPEAVPRKGPVIVTFFASWCPPCTDEFEHLNAIAANDAHKDATIVAINLFEDFGGEKNPERMARFLAQTQPQFRLIEGTPAMRSAFGDIDRIPTVVVYGASGDEIWRFVHERNAEKTHATRQDLERALALDKSVGQ